MPPFWHPSLESDMMSFHALLLNFGVKWWNQLSSPVTMFVVNHCSQLHVFQEA
jgi:hypothetical protein